MASTQMPQGAVARSRTPRALRQLRISSYRLPAVVSIIAAGSVASGWCVASSDASPSDGRSENCSFVLTPPKVVQVSSTQMVVATLKPGPCTIDAIPNESVVCLAIEGSGSNGQCAHRLGSDAALVYYPYRTGATYVVTGRGCAHLIEDPVTGLKTGPVTKLCQSIGPTSFTL